ncbi:aliphatic sulfonate ABC transporter substrate-binding protein [Pseudonocardia sp. MH-G8]|uniref:aliphatic sulfonate ABC transporter substrate-binding protein n=1 Tax=Pseudonocardia sp. MH-G8 TaxID=1854588 RepID=UPI000B9FA591|nr:aliphatic sulfonate ABC transporter substrate-binding protein [Pseudonocardia sp. MH-G8]OZM77395.1 bicyclomycin resistance protein [Pseudonocardia sp. MH-G8]
MNFRKKLLGVVAASALALTACGGGGSGEGGETIDVTFGYIGDFNGTSLLAVAEQEGIWEKHGLDVTPKVFTNGPLQIQALGTGDLDFGYIGPGAMWLPASGQAKVVAINTLGEADRVVAQAGITSMQDLRGKTVAVPEGTSGDMILTLALEEAGMTVDDIERVPMEPAAIVAALSSKQVDAAGFWYPALATVKQQVPDLVELAQNTDFEDTVAFPTAFVAGNDVVANEAEKTTRVLAALREAMQYRTDQPGPTIEATAAMLGIEAAQVEADAGNVQVLPVAELDRLTTDGTVTKWLAGMNDYFVAAGKLDAPVEPSEYYTGDLFTGAGQ